MDFEALIQIASQTVRPRQLTEDASAGSVCGSFGDGQGKCIYRRMY